ncbi:glycosyl transferase family protein [Caulobacter sp. 17J65-9]|uniref:glycosyl transferase family protein n=1 Tax=Caulobacter sp. 17J65-9 TaxID=2709382 RepID=UPI0013C62FDE|nr:glycosyl transferase family protein [Caulobacter sp. 17J65-9]
MDGLQTLLFDVLLAYWGGLKIAIAMVAVIIFVSSIDDLIIDFYYWHRAWRRGWRGLVKKPPSQEALAAHPEKRIALMVPAWQESDVIANMIANTTNTFDYSNYEIFVGVYANDPDTRREVDRIRQRFPNVHRADVPHDGPTSKADCLNWLVQNIFLHGEKTGRPFDVILMHDAEDVVHPFGLKVVNWFIEGRGMIQLPVLSMNRRWWSMIACHYMDEFAEFHGKDLPVRSLLARMTPSAGVATAFSREAMVELCREKDNQPFNTDSLTEDYDVGHRLRSVGMTSRFVAYHAKTKRFRKAWFRKGEVEVERHELVATKEFFPDQWTASVRQKARWMLGISYLGWRQLGWFGDVNNRYFLFRDRKALITAPTGVIAYLLVLQVTGWTVLGWFLPAVRGLPPLIDHAWVLLLVQINFLFLMNRLAHRALFTFKHHGLKYVWLTPLRAALSNCVGFAAFWRSMRLFLTHLATGRPIAWDKTQHSFPSLAELQNRRGRLGDVLRFWNHVTAEDLDAAIQAQADRYRPIGRLLVDRGVISDEHLAEAFAEWSETVSSSFDPFRVTPDVLRLLSARDAARFGAVPLRWNESVLDIALAEPLEKAERVELERRLGAVGVKSLRVVYAPLSDIAFGVRYAWTPGALARERRQVERLVECGLLDAVGAAQLWRSIRSGYRSLGDVLIQEEAIDHRTLHAALSDYWRTNAAGRLDQYLVRTGVVSQAQVDAAVRRQTIEPLDVVRRALDLKLISVQALQGLQAA